MAAKERRAAELERMKAKADEACAKLSRDITSIKQQKVGGGWVLGSPRVVWFDGAGSYKLPIAMNLKTLIEIGFFITLAGKRERF